MADQPVDYIQAEALGISREAYDQVLDIVGRIPTEDEVATLLAMWDQSGRQQSLYRWLRGQNHTVQREEYIYHGTADHTLVREPKVKECLEIAHMLCLNMPPIQNHSEINTGMLLYLVGNIGTEFADSEYARRYLHLVSNPRGAGNDIADYEYTKLIVDALFQGAVISSHVEVSIGGLFCSLLRLTAPLGYDILTPREVRLDAFLFGEEDGRYLSVLPENNDDTFLQKLTEARLNCCFLGRTTKGRIIIDGYDFGANNQYMKPAV